MPPRGSQCGNREWVHRLREDVPGNAGHDQSPRPPLPWGQILLQPQDLMGPSLGNGPYPPPVGMGTQDVAIHHCSLAASAP